MPIFTPSRLLGTALERNAKDIPKSVSIGCGIFVSS
jgi:hypothetical protein